MTMAGVVSNIVAAHSLDAVGKHPDFGAGAATLRWMLIHVIEETARHGPHLVVAPNSESVFGRTVAPTAAVQTPRVDGRAHHTGGVGEWRA